MKMKVEAVSAFRLLFYIKIRVEDRIETTDAHIGAVPSGVRVSCFDIFCSAILSES